jgi:hypothetical protein
MEDRERAFVRERERERNYGGKKMVANRKVRRNRSALKNT